MQKTAIYRGTDANSIRDRNIKLAVNVWGEFLYVQARMGSEANRLEGLTLETQIRNR